MTTLPTEVAEKIRDIRLLLLDVDGVLTDGRFGLMAGGGEIKFFSSHDGFGIRLMQKAGWAVGFLSGRKSQEVALRANELGVNIVIEGSVDKVKDFEKILSQQNLDASQVAYMGDDLPDLPVLKRVGFSAAPHNATEAIKESVDYVTKRKGGEGAVREVVELLLQSSGTWADVLAHFS